MSTNRLIIVLGRNYKIPNVVAERTSRVRSVDVTLIPNVDEAVQMYTDAGGTITQECSFGIDPLAAHQNLKNRREAHFSQMIGSFTGVYNNVISGDGSLLQSAILLFFNTTTELAIPLNN